jgi:phosphatidylserine/phosphatidylglycerophosphate/cardiolipin synthase-like enzyme
LLAVADESALLKSGRNCWRIERADRLRVIIDAAEYFEALHTAMLSAQRRIMLIGWDFDARIKLVDQAESDAPATIGDFILWLSRRRPELEIRLLRWDVGMLPTVFRGTTAFTLLRWQLRQNIDFKLDGAHPIGASHHSKIVVIDDCLAFCGGIDITSGRWDTREHRDDDPRRMSPGGRLQDPWHDATTAVDGPAAAALGELARDRWKCAGGEELAPIEGVAPCWPDGLDVQLHDCQVAIARTRPDHADDDAIHEIERQTLDLIARARQILYVESQYFASRKLAEAVARRLAEPLGPEIVVVGPQTAEGWLDREAMDTARARLIEALRRVDPHGRFRVYHPFTKGGAPIYVHAKIVIVDDQVIRVGSSNWNNRSLRLDTECDVTIDAALAKDPTATAETIRSLRNSLVAEHLGIDQAMVDASLDATGSLTATIERLSDGTRLRPYEVPDLSAVERYLADHEVLDPEGPEEMFEPIASRSLFRRLPRPER